MVLRLDPRLPLVWRSPTSLQIGVSRAVVTIDNVTVAVERMLAALAGGVPLTGLVMIARSAGLRPDEIEAFLALVDPALVVETASPEQRVVVAGEGPTADAVARLVAAGGSSVRITRTVASAELEACDLAIAVGSFVLDPALHGLWLRRDVPHLAVVIADTSVAIGPLVEPGRTACLYCEQLHATDADPAWPAMASQLWGRAAAADTPLVASQAAAIAARLVARWFALGGEAASGQIRLDATTGATTTGPVAPHPACGCLTVGLTNGESLALQLGEEPAGAALPAPTGRAG